ncbi:MAG TPA: N-acetylmuramoyl-L-alanine amidase [Candidatus Acidoferrales bacterium]|nr:N-acetylmuramoyl-L-alanine amidase [Candidatus Acidoferrales bacterium]
MRGQLEDATEGKRTADQYQTLITAYRRVYLITPREKDVPTAMMIVGDLYRTMGRRFDAKYYRNAIDSYQLLLHEYPESKYCEDALLSVAQIEQDNLKDLPLAQKTYEAFLRMHPKSARTVQAKLAISEIQAARRGGASSTTSASSNSSHDSGLKLTGGSLPPATGKSPDTPQWAAAPANADKPAALIAQTTASSASAPPPINPSQKMEEPTSKRPVSLNSVRTWSMPDYTRVVVSVQGPVKYQSARVATPDRIYFDVSSTVLDRSLLHAPIQVQGDHVTAVRVAQYQASTVRVVLQVAHIKTYSVYLLREPYRMVIDLYPDTPAATVVANVPAAKNPVPDSSTQQPASADKLSLPPAQKPDSQQSTVTAVAEPPRSVDAKPTGEHVVNIAEQEKAADAALANAAKDQQADSTAVPPPHSKTNPFQGSPATHSNTKTSSKNAVMASPTASTASNSKAKPVPPTVAQPNLDGGRSLTRALGLKIGRIVIDAGHGGHDTGTIGPTGLMEKDLCLDVALRLGKLIQQSLPGAEVVYTRDDDTFIPLERRTEIANESKADLFISIHANSSEDRAARGVETYYLNFSPSREAMEVAARENATAQQNVHDLDSLVQRIARNEKIEESKEFAGDVQGALSKRLQRTSPAIRDRGVRKAPFVVLIGANMPSVLAEISFISNPTDESRLKRPENRQHVAEGLYKGMEAYLHSMNSLANNQTKVTATASRGSLPSSGNQQ